MSESSQVKKLIEVSIPLERINAESAREKSIRHGHPSTLHLYWSRKPLATARSVLLAQLIDDPSSRPDLFPTEEAQQAERARLHALIGELAKWENSNDPALLTQAREAIRRSNGGELPEVLDPFAGGGSIPLEAQRLGLPSEASDLNPLAVLLNKALIDFPSRFPGAAPVFPGAAGERSSWPGAEGLAEDVLRYGQWMREEAFRRVGHLYPTVRDENGVERTVIAWKWARTVRNPNPANPTEVPLVNSWWLSRKKGKEAWVEPIVEGGEVRYRVRHDADGPTGDADGTVNRKGAVSVIDGTPIDFKYIRREGQSGRLGSRMMAIISEGKQGRFYSSPEQLHETRAEVSHPMGLPTASLPESALGFRVQVYGMTRWTQLFTNRQLVTLTTLSDLVAEVRERVFRDALAAGLPAGERIEAGGSGAAARADAVAAYLALAVSRQTDYCSSLCSWNSARDGLRNVFARQAIPMVWDYAEANPFSSSSGNFLGQVEWVAKALAHVPALPPSRASQADAATRDYSGKVISTDPPYYDNIGYSDLSDYFYVWLRRSLRTILPRSVATMLTPKAEELVASPYRHGGKDEAAAFFVEGFNNVFARIRQGARPDVPLTVYYAYKQQDTDASGTTNTGWHTLLEGLIGAGWQVTATWPMRSERGGRMLSVGTNALASSIVLACRPRPADAPTISRTRLLAELRDELPGALDALKAGGIAPVDLNQAALGPGIAVLSRYSRIRDTSGTDVTMREALALINEVIDSVLNEAENTVDADTRFALRWYRSCTWNADASGLADQVARTADTSLAALERGGILATSGGKARLLPPTELAEEWDPTADAHVSIWEATLRLAGILNARGIDATVPLIPGIRARLDLESIKDLAYLLFNEASKRSDGANAQIFNGLVTAWEHLVQRAKDLDTDGAAHQDALDVDDPDHSLF